MGYQPKKRKTSPKVAPAQRVMTLIVVKEEIRTERATKLMRVRMTTGLSRERVGDGRVVGER